MAIPPRIPARSGDSPDLSELRRATDFASFLAAAGPVVEAELEAWLPPADAEPTMLHAAMRHSMFPGGKRLRPMLSLLASRVTGGDLARTVAPAIATECLHTYSLIHDDLPCMDDDALRRGRPTCHVVFGEAVAVLAGDALHSLAFEAAAKAGGAVVSEFARAAGAAGMVGGQVGDMVAEGQSSVGGSSALGLRDLEWIHDRKTGALITASLVMGAMAGGGATADAECLAALRIFGDRIGRAFQITDDCLDCTGDAAALGKAPGQDEAAGKLTYPAVVGLEASVRLADELVAEAIEQIPRIAVGSSPSTTDPHPSAQPAPDPQGTLDWNCRLLQDVALFVVARRS